MLYLVLGLNLAQEHLRNGDKGGKGPFYLPKSSKSDMLFTVLVSCFLREEEEDEQLNKLMKDFSEYLHRLRGSHDPSHRTRSLVTTSPHRCSRAGNYPIEDFPSSAALIELDRILTVV